MVGTSTTSLKAEKTPTQLEQKIKTPLSAVLLINARCKILRIMVFLKTFIWCLHAIFKILLMRVFPIIDSWNRKNMEVIWFFFFNMHLYAVIASISLHDFGCKKGSKFLKFKYTKETTLVIIPKTTIYSQPLDITINSIFNCVLKR